MRVDVNVFIQDESRDETWPVVAYLERLGMQVTSVVTGLGLIAGKIEETEIFRLRRVRIVRDVESVNKAAADELTAEAQKLGLGY